MVKHTQTIRQQIADELLSVFDRFGGLALKGLTEYILDLVADRPFVPNGLQLKLTKSDCHGFFPGSFLVSFWYW